MKYEILSFKKSHHECGVRIAVVGHENIFVYDDGIITIAVDNEPLSIDIMEYQNEMDYSKEPAKIIGEDKSHVNKCVITGRRDDIVKFNRVFGYSDLNFFQNEKINLRDAIDDLQREINYLRNEIETLNENKK